MVDSRNEAKLIETAKAFRAQILAQRERIEADRRPPDGLVRALARAGFFRIFLPALCGGLDLSPLAAMEVFEELARGCIGCVVRMEWKHLLDDGAVGKGGCPRGLRRSGCDSGEQH